MITHEQIRAARKLLGWSAATLAIKSIRTVIGVARVESGKLRPNAVETSLRKIQAVFEAEGVEFVDGGVRLSIDHLPPTHPLITAAQIQEARRLLGWSADSLASRAKMGLATIKKAERSGLLPQNTERQLGSIRRTLEAAGVEFLDDQPGVRLRGVSTGL